jgi:hypothetical protein
MSAWTECPALEMETSTVQARQYAGRKHPREIWVERRDQALQAFARELIIDTFSCPDGELYLASPSDVGFPKTDFFDFGIKRNGSAWEIWSDGELIEDGITFLLGPRART